MSAQPLFAWSLELLSGPSGLLRVLAVAGGAAVGGLALGALTQLLVKVLTAQKLPPWPLWGVRLLGAILGGLLVMLWAFGGGGGGLGGPGGLGLGGGKGKGNGEAAKKTESGAGGKDRKEVDTEVPPNTVRVEVLGNDVLKRIAGERTPDLEKRYRMTPGDRKLLTLDEVRARLRQLHDEGKVKAVEIVGYRPTSPSRENVYYVKPLEDEARGLFKKNVTVTWHSKDAPD
jgi:hypothetical protein